MYNLSTKVLSGSSSVGRASAFQAEGRRFEPGLPLQNHQDNLSILILINLIIWQIFEGENREIHRACEMDLVLLDLLNELANVGNPPQGRRPRTTRSPAPINIHHHNVS